jgi:hypothetical protein
VDVAQDVRKNEGSLAEIRFIAEVYKVQTLVDGGVRVTLDLPETAIPQMAMLAECQRDGIPLVFVATVEEEKDLNRPKANRL